MNEISYRIKNFKRSAIFICIIIAVVLDVILETLGRHSLIGAVKYIGQHPMIFLYNCSIIFFTLTLALLIRKRIFGYCLVSAAWLLCGVTNAVVLGFRITPFSAVDMLMARNMMTIIDKYFEPWQVVLIGLALFAVLAGIIVLYIKSPTVTGNIFRVRTTMFIVATFCFVMLFTKIALNTEAISDNFSNLATAYKEYGFVYCFSNSVVDVGIGESETYSESEMLDLKAELDQEKATWNIFGKDHPNIIVVQLESFMDPKYVNGLELSEDPIPTFTKMKEECTSGFLTMPAIGAGTANSEFEVLSGFNVAYFGAGEYPYKTILGSTKCETMANQLSGMGYSTHAMHNHDGTFYDRYKVYANMGFDTFTPMEYMYDLETTQKNWEKDNVLTGEIMKTMKSTEEQDFVFTVSVQGHGRYPEELDEVNYSYPIKATGMGSEGLDIQWTYYCNQLHEMDQFIADLIEELKSFDEDVVLVMYGDHLPGFDFTEESVANANLYQTEYFIWSNMEKFPVRDEDLYSYQLSTKLFNMLGLEKTYMMKFNDLYKPGDVNFDTIMHDMEYDMLYGKRYLYSEQWPNEFVEMTYGIDKICITGTEVGEYTYTPEDEDLTDEEVPEEVTQSGLYIYGENFNECSFVWFDDEYLPATIYIDRNTLFLPNPSFETGAELYVAQVGDDSIDIGKSEVYIYTGPSFGE